eukprot:111-Karenia_brevis.AAC.1
MFHGMLEELDAVIHCQKHITESKAINRLDVELHKSKEGHWMVNLHELPPQETGPTHENCFTID